MLEVRNLTTEISSTTRSVTVVSDVSFSIEKGETLGLVGESGSGKTMTALSILRLLPQGARIRSGSIVFGGRDLATLTAGEMRRVRGNEIAMIFQDPMTSLNPVFTIGNQIIEAIREHNDLAREDARKRSLEVLHAVGIPDSERRLRQYPHQLSGGLRQRAMIAMALSCHPKLLIADEPTTALDVTLQAQILELLKNLREQFSLSMLLITHDLGVVAENADRVAVMYAGKIVEVSPASMLFSSPRHPYTEGLLESIPKLGEEDAQRLHTIDGTVPNLAALPKGCAFAPRCGYRIDECAEEEIPLFELGPQRASRCLRYEAVGRI